MISFIFIGLLCNIVSVLTQTSLKSKIHMGYGVGFHKEASLTPNVNKYDVFVKVPLTNVPEEWHQLRIEVLDTECNAVRTMGADVFQMCVALQPIYAQYKHRVYEKQMKIYNALRNELPLLIPRYNPKLKMPEKPRPLTDEWTINTPEAQQHLRALKILLLENGIESEFVKSWKSYPFFKDLVLHPESGNYTIEQVVEQAEDEAQEERLQNGGTVPSAAGRLPPLWEAMYPVQRYKHTSATPETEGTLRAVLSDAWKRIRVPTALTGREKRVATIPYIEVRRTVHSYAEPKLEAREAKLTQIKNLK